MVTGNPSLLTQLFQNLISNALKFHRPGVPPQIHLSAQRQQVEAAPDFVQAQWRFALRDNGLGIEPQYFDSIFVIFQRWHTREAYPGHGLELALCKKIVEWHGGQI